MAQLTFRLVTNTVSDFYPHSCRYCRGILWFKAVYSQKAIEKKEEVWWRAAGARIYEYKGIARKC